LLIAKELRFLKTGVFNILGKVLAQNQRQQNKQ